MKRRVFAGLFLLALPIATLGMPEVVVLSAGGSISNIQRNLVSGSWEISFTAVGAPAMIVGVQVTANNSEKIRWVRVESNDPLNIGTVVQVVVRRKPGTNGLLERVEEVSVTSSDPIRDGEVWVTVQTTGTSGGADANIGRAGTTLGGLIEGHIIVQLAAQATGNLTAPVRTLGRIGGGNTSSILSVAINGNILNDLTATTGVIEDITAGLDIGTPSDPIAITTTGNVGGSKGIQDISADSIYADITTPNTASVRGDIKSITTTVGNFVGSLTTFAMQGTGAGVQAIDIAGDLDAVISVFTIKRPVDIAGDLVSGASITYSGASRAEGPITILGDLGGLLNFATTTASQNDADIILGTSLVPGSILSTGKISIDKDIDGDITVYGDMSGTIDIGTTLGGDLSVGASGLVGQVIINSDDDSGSWTGAVTVGSTSLSPKNAYTQTGLGGGAVGLVPFDCHLQDCDPPYIGANEPIVGEGHASIVLDEVTLRHYGPVTWGSGAMPIKVTVCITGTECDQHTDVTSDWTVDNSPGGRDVVVKYDGGGVPDTGHDHFTPVRTGANKLECTGITASGVVVAGWEYTLQYDG